MGYPTFTQAEEKYQAEVKRLDKIATNVVNSDHGSFLKAIADAWLLADNSNKRILRSGWAAIVTKHGLAEEVDGC